MKTTLPRALHFVATAKPGSGAKLGNLLFKNWLSPVLRKQIKYAPRTSHTNSLGWLEFTLANALESVTGPFAIRFVPGTEDALSAVAALHWTELALAHLLATRKDFATWLAASGVEIKDPRDLATLLEAPSAHPLVEVVVQEKTYLVGVTHGDSGSFIVDVDVGPQSRVELSPTDIARLDHAVQTGVCACFFCTSLKSKTPKAKVIKPAKKTPAKKTSAKKTPAKKTPAKKTSPKKR